MTPYLAAIEGSARLPDGQAQALRSHARHHDQPGIEHGDLPPQQARSRLPVQARAARLRRRSCLDAASRAAAAARDRPVQDRRLRGGKVSSCSSATRASASGRPRRSRTATPTGSSSGTATRARPRSARWSAGPPTSRRTASIRPGRPRSRPPCRRATRAGSTPRRSSSILGLWLNTRLAPFNDVRVRQAFNLAVDRNRLAQINAGEVACQFLPPNVKGYSSYCPYNGPNLAKARRLVAESGTKGQPVTIWIYDIPAGHRNAAYLVSVLRSIGYKARVEYVPHDGRTSPGAPTARRASEAGAPTTRPPTTSSSRSSAAPTRATPSTNLELRPSSATGVSTPRSLVLGRSRRPTPPRRPAPGTEPTAC